MFPCNCFICAIILWLIYGGKFIASNRPGTRIPHWLVVCRDGSIRHFKISRDIFPPPFCYLISLGSIEKIS